MRVLFENTGQYMTGMYALQMFCQSLVTKRK